MLKRYWLLLVITSFICCSTSTITVKASPLQSIKNACVLKYRRMTKHMTDRDTLKKFSYVMLSFSYGLYSGLLMGYCAKIVMRRIATLELSQEKLFLTGFFFGVYAVVVTASAAIITTRVLQKRALRKLNFSKSKY